MSDSLKDIASSEGTLRDWFAGQALVGLANRYGNGGDAIGVEYVTACAYQYADAMLAERAKATGA